MRHNLDSGRWAIALAATSAFALLLMALPAGTSDARGLGAGVGGGANIGAGVGGGHVGAGLGAGTAVGAGGAGANANVGGSSSAHMSDQGLSNTNGPNASDPDRGLGRAEDRANQEGLNHGKALDGDLSVKGHASGKGGAY